MNCDYPKGATADAITNDFGSYERFQSLFTDVAAKHFGSGMGGPRRKPVDRTTRDRVLPNQDSVLLQGKSGLRCDVWEHAYYLRYRNRHPDYLLAWWNVVAWDVDERLHNFMALRSTGDGHAASGGTRARHDEQPARRIANANQ